MLLGPLERAIEGTERLRGREIFFTKNLIGLSREMDLSRFGHVRFRDLFMPFQLVPAPSPRVEAEPVPEAVH